MTNTAMTIEFGIWDIVVQD